MLLDLGEDQTPFLLSGESRCERSFSDHSAKCHETAEKSKLKSQDVKKSMLYSLVHKKKPNLLGPQYLPLLSITTDQVASKFQGKALMVLWPVFWAFALQEG